MGFSFQDDLPKCPLGEMPGAPEIASTTLGAVPSGNSKIELILQDCVVQENWKSLSSPYAGQSYNIYNATLKRWEQYWVDNVGGNVLFYGGLKDGVTFCNPMAQNSSVRMAGRSRCRGGLIESYQPLGRWASVFFCVALSTAAHYNPAIPRS